MSNQINGLLHDNIEKLYFLQLVSSIHSFSLFSCRIKEVLLGLKLSQP